MTAIPQLQTRIDTRGPLRLAAIGAPLLFVSLLAWAAMTPLHGAVVVSGAAVAEGQNRKLQHLDGGIIAQIDVHNGDQVEAGQELIALDPTVLRTSLGILDSRLAEGLARQARLRAEAADLPVEQGFAPDPADPALALLTNGGGKGSALQLALKGQEQIRTARADVRASQEAQTTERVAQLSGQTDGLDGLIAAREEQLSYIDEDIANLSDLVEQGLAARPRLLEAQRNRAELLGQLAEYRSNRAGIANSVREAELDLARNESSFREQVATDLRDTESQISETVQQIVTTRAQLDRVVLRAPVAGTVHEMQVTTIGGVITPGETLMQIVPSDEALEFELRLDPRAIDDVRIGQPARLVLPGLRDPGTPDLYGQIASISPSTIEDPRTGQSYYRLRVALPESEIDKLPGKPVPGMPVEAYLETGDHVALRWMLKPLLDHLGTAFREK